MKCPDCQCSTQLLDMPDGQGVVAKMAAAFFRLDPEGPTTCIEPKHLRDVRGHIISLLEWQKLMDNPVTKGTALRVWVRHPRHQVRLPQAPPAEAPKPDPVPLEPPRGPEPPPHKDTLF